jgi:hypothetical protein
MQQKPGLEYLIKHHFFFLVLAGLPLFGQHKPFHHPPPALSDSTATAVHIAFITGSTDLCDLPGTVPDFGDDSSCFHPLMDYINRYEKGDTGASGILDSINEDNYRIALSTYNALSRIPNNGGKEFHFSHTRYLSLITRPEEPEELPWLLKKLKQILSFLNKYVWQPLKKLLVIPFKGLALGWQIFLITVAALVFIAVIVMASKGISRMSYVSDYSQQGEKGLQSGTVRIKINRLALARELLEKGNLLKALEVMYQWLIEIFSGRGRIKTYEWWTNRQFLTLIKGRFPAGYGISSKIINQYEEAVYGHREIDTHVLNNLIEEAHTSLDRK